MIKTNKIIPVILGVLLLALLFSFFLADRCVKELPAGSVSVTLHGKDSVLALEEQKLQDVKGMLLNGKGEAVELEGKGLCLSSLADEAVEKLTVISKDNYTAELDGDELVNAYLFLDGDSVRLVVFGDTNMRRNVRNVAAIVIE